MASKPLRVLIIEDSEDDAQLVVRELRRAGREVAFERVETPEAMAAALDRESWDLFVSDYRMPRFLAPEALALYRERSLDAPFIVVSGTIGEEQAVEVMRAGAHDFFLKDRLTRFAAAVERELREAGSRRARRSLARAIEQSPLSVVLTDAQGRIEYVNPAFTAITGYTPEEAQGRLLDSGAQDAAVYASLWQTIRAGHEWRGEVVNRRKDGSHYVQDTSISPLSLGGRIDGFVAIGADITERRRAETELRESRARLEEAQRIAHIGSWEHDLAADKFRYSDEMYRLLGVGPEDFAGTMEAFVALIHPDDRATMAAYVKSVLGGHSSSEVDFRVVRPDGTVRRMQGRAQPFFDPSGKPCRVAGSLQDLTERRLAEDSLRCQEQRFRSLIENSTEITALLGPGGNLRYLSPAFEHVLGQPAEVWLGQSVLDLVWPEDLARAKALLERVLQSPAEAIAWQSRLRHAKGGWRWLEGTAANLIAEPAVEGIVVNCHDVTERKLAEERQSRTEQMLWQSQKMEAIGRLAGGVAHDFNNMLGVITGFGELARRQLPPDHPVQDRLEQILKASSRAADLTRQLLAFSRQQVMRPHALELNAVVEGTRNMLGPLIGEDIELVLRLDPHLGTVMADPTQLDQVLMNLAVNARDAMRQGGRLSFETANVELDEDYVRRHLAGKPGSYVRLAVSDTGVGMDEETRCHIFEPFFTTKAESKGTGLGLATVYGIVKQSGGFIWVYSEPSQGATFKIYLPRVDASQGRETAAPGAAEMPRGTETILVAEDQEALREMIREVLQQQGYTVLAVANGNTALELSRRHTGPLHLMLADVVMPGMNGREVAERLAAERPDMRTLYMSGYTNGTISDRGLLAEGVVLVEKPFTAASLAQAVRKALDAG
jgi:PAS domain S-box-containing protein